MITASRSTAYGWLMLAGIFVSLLFWRRLARRDERLLVIYVAALIGAFLGAKMVYVLAEGWQHGAKDVWLQFLANHSRRLARQLLDGNCQNWSVAGIVTGSPVAPVGIIVGASAPFSVAVWVKCASQPQFDRDSTGFAGPLWRHSFNIGHDHLLLRKNKIGSQHSLVVIAWNFRCSRVVRATPRVPGRFPVISFAMSFALIVAFALRRRSMLVGKITALDDFISAALSKQHPGAI
jgi:hypothetical protein